VYGSWVLHVEDTILPGIQRIIYLYTTSKSACPTCLAATDYDSVNDCSFNPKCAICKGAYWVLTEVANAVPARIRWTNDQNITATPGGKYYVGDATAKIGLKYYDLAMSCQTFTGHVLVDGHDMTISKIVPVGTPIITQYHLVLKNMGNSPK